MSYSKAPTGKETATITHYRYSTIEAVGLSQQAKSSIIWDFINLFGLLASNLRTVAPLPIIVHIGRCLGGTRPPIIILRVLDS